MRGWTLSAVAGLSLLAACTAAPPPAPPAGPARLALAPVGFDQLPGWRDDDPRKALSALRRSCAKISDLPPDQAVGRDATGGTAADWLGPCGAADHVSEGDEAAVRAYFESWFQPFRAGGAGGKPLDGLFTGYFEAELKGSLHEEPAYRVPLLRRPDDLVSADLGDFAADLKSRRIWGRLQGERLVPYWSRAEIEAGALGAHASPLLWVGDAVDAHILEIQGSGRILLDDGRMVRVGFDGTNGRTFVGLSKILLDAGKIAAGETTMPAVRAWLEAHPAEAPALMDKNPRYVFFRLVSGDGPVGAEGVVLTPGRSLAVDPAFVPLGVPLWLDSATPDGQPLRRLMVAQDTGAAIQGPVRGDVFWGAGDEAFQQAGRMKSHGTYYLLLPRQRSNRLALAAPAIR